jgi:glycosyltransferase involved in cell wall biosynthesis
MHKSNSINVTIVSSSDESGGAAKAAYRLHKALLVKNINSSMVVQKKISDNVFVYGPSSNIQRAFSIIRPLIERLIIKLIYRKKNNGLFSIGWIRSKKFVKQINALNPDIVHLHWVNGGMLRIEDIKKINAPIIWSLQDMWPFTGGCHFDEDCEGYLKNCGNCKVLSSKNEYDLSRLTFKRKEKAFKKTENLVINGVSKWIAECAEKSSLFKEKSVNNIPNLLDTNLFKPIKKEIARQVFKVPAQKKVILFGASSIIDDRKGYKLLLNALSEFTDSNTIFVIAGQSEPLEPIKLKIPVYYIPPQHDDASLALMYNCADVVLVPSIQENLSNMIIESLACGVPVVAFNIGGNADMIEHKRNGYLANALDKNDMLSGIRWVINEDIIDLSDNSRKKVLENFSDSVVVRRYLDLYKKYMR